MPRPSPSRIVFPPRTPDPASRFRQLDPAKIYVWGSLADSYDMRRALGSLVDPRNPATGFPEGSFGGAIRPSDGRFVYLDREGAVRVFMPESAADPEINPPACSSSGRAASVMFDAVTGELYAGCAYLDARKVTHEFLHCAGEPVVVPLPAEGDTFRVIAPPVDGALLGWGRVRGKLGLFVTTARVPREPYPLEGPTGASIKSGAYRSGWNLVIGDADRSAVHWRIDKSGRASRIADLGAGRGEVEAVLPSGEIAQAFYALRSPGWAVVVKLKGARGSQEVYTSANWVTLCEKSPCVHFYDPQGGTKWIQMVTGGTVGNEWGL